MFDRLAKISTLLLGFDAFSLNKKFLVVNLVDRNLKIKYRRSFLGFFWTIVSPIVMSLIFYFVFKVVLKVQKEHYLALIICGLMPWNFFAQTMSESTESIAQNAPLISKIPVPIHIFAYVTSITNFSTLALSVPVIAATAFISGIPFGFHSLWLFYFLFILMLITYAGGTILSILFVYFRDLKHAVGLILQIWFYATPVLYEASMVPEKYRFILYLNPVGTVFEGIQKTFILGQQPGAHILFANLAWVVISFSFLRLTHSQLKPGLVERI